MTYNESLVRRLAELFFISDENLKMPHSISVVTQKNHKLSICLNYQTYAISIKIDPDMLMYCDAQDFIDYVYNEINYAYKMNITHEY